MKIFQSLCAHFSKLGINSSQSTEEYPFNVKNVFGLLWVSLMVILSNTISDAHSFKDYIIILNASIHCNVVCIEYALHVWKMQKIFQFIVCLDTLIQKSEYNFFKSRINSKWFGCVNLFCSRTANWYNVRINSSNKYWECGKIGWKFVHWH